ncbi:hypothetical protein EGW08_000699 [Elysia chlorotica]|uniref:Aquaporin n=1 Tax=Elysia chlorotica TaxID=188477 RepID=A0A3S1BXV5_ELYCH|nr:hypothetical protein EGW08_000699 [Elysia chlorotica]
MQDQSIDWRAVWLMTTGQEPGVDFVPPYVASLLFFAINMLSGIVLRTLSSAFLPQPARGLVVDFLCTMEACAYFFENNFVLKYYGSLWFIIAIVGQCFVCSRTFGEGSENPVKALLQLLNNNISVLEALVQVVVQSLAGLASYRFARMVWSLDLIADHHERFYETSCDSDLQVTLLTGFAVELVASLVDTWAGMQTISATPLLDELIKYFGIASMIAYGVATTGMYFNPAMATGHMYGCKGTAVEEHFFVYWAGPFAGGVVGYMLNKMIHIDFSSPAAVREEKKKQ